MDYLRMINPSQLMAERGSNLVVINPGSANVRIGLAREQMPFNIPHCIAWHVKGRGEVPKFTMKDQFINSQATYVQGSEREEVYKDIASSMKVRFIDEDAEDSPFPRKALLTGMVAGGELLFRTCFRRGRGHIRRWCPTLLRRSKVGGGIQEAIRRVRPQASKQAAGSRARPGPRSYADVLNGGIGTRRQHGKVAREADEDTIKRRLKDLTGARWGVVRVALKLFLGVGSCVEGTEKVVEAAFFAADSLRELPASIIVSFYGEQLVVRCVVLQERASTYVVAASRVIGAFPG
ncbi:hypothetical protein Taro_038090, partial [Colocasia esculenta]|nr:hypothetical protein [Colocasia esculenta]